MDVPLPRFEISMVPGASYGFLDTPIELDDAITSLTEYFPRILQLAELEQSVRLLAREDALERSSTSRLMKIDED